MNFKCQSFVCSSVLHLLLHLSILFFLFFFVVVLCTFVLVLFRVLSRFHICIVFVPLSLLYILRKLTDPGPNVVVPTVVTCSEDENDEDESPPKANINPSGAELL